MPSDGVCFEHVQSVCCRPSFYAIPPHSLPCHGDTAALLSYPRHAGQRSGMFLGRRLNTVLV